MGGDAAPRTPVRGALSALRELGGDLEIVLVGDEARLRPLVDRARGPTGGLVIHHAPEAVGMDESPTAALRRKHGSSIRVGLELHRAGEVDAFVSAGNTGAVMAMALTVLGRITSISRPAIVTIFPTRHEPCLVLDVGANVDSKPHHLLQFAWMGHVYAADVLGRERPRVALLSIGEEPGKGNELTRAAHPLLAASGLRFIGNVEGRDVLKGVADVVVCDGFVGNVMLKFGESLVDFLAAAIREETERGWRTRVGALLMRPAFRALRRRIDYAEYGGAPLLGVDGIVIVGHGGSNVKAFRNAIGVARRAVERGLAGHIEQAVREHRGGPSGGPTPAPVVDPDPGAAATGLGGRR